MYTDGCDVKKRSHFSIDDAVDHLRIDPKFSRFQFNPPDQDSSLILRHCKAIV